MKPAISEDGKDIYPFTVVAFEARPPGQINYHSMGGMIEANSLDEALGRATRIGQRFLDETRRQLAAQGIGIEYWTIKLSQPHILDPDTDSQFFSPDPNKTGTRGFG